MEKCNLFFDTDKKGFVIVNEETGEVTDLKLSKPSTRKSATKKVDNDPTPRLLLEDNKYTLNNAAIELLGVEPDDRLDIRYEKDGKFYTPVIGTDLNFKTIGKGNKLTKAGTVSLRGKKREELEPFGTEFTIEPHPTKEGLFILKGTTDVLANNVIDDNIKIDEDEPDLTGLVDESEDDNEITAFNFTL